jgi:prophage regulatory protein
MGPRSSACYSNPQCLLCTRQACGQAFFRRTIVQLNVEDVLPRLIRLKEVQHRVGLGRSTIYRWMAEGKFPKPVQLGGYAVAWAEADIQVWISAKLG